MTQNYSKTRAITPWRKLALVGLLGLATGGMAHPGRWLQAGCAWPLQPPGCDAPRTAPWPPTGLPATATTAVCGPHRRGVTRGGHM